MIVGIVGKPLAPETEALFGIALAVKIKCNNKCSMKLTGIWYIWTLNSYSFEDSPIPFVVFEIMYYFIV